MAISALRAEELMRRALDLAALGLGRVEPNPAVGAVIADSDGNVLGEGWHQQFGGPHAEVHALANAGSAAFGATLFVTLEPCCHYGKTPPCSRAVIAAGIRKVVVATLDPAPHVNGGGIAELRAAGVEVEVGVLQEQARRLIAPFVTLMTLRRPYFHAKWAMTLDGKIASRTGHSQWISNEQSRAVVHRLRGRMDGILVGIGTALADDPALTARPVGPRKATRIIIDSTGRLPSESELVRTARVIPVLVVTASASESDRQRLTEAGVEVLSVPSNLLGKPDLGSLATELGRRRMTNVLVEGGGQILGAFFDAELIDEVHTFVAPKIVGGVSSPSPVSGSGESSIPATSSIVDPEIELLGDNLYIHGPFAH